MLASFCILPPPFSSIEWRVLGGGSLGLQRRRRRRLRWWEVERRVRVRRGPHPSSSDPVNSAAAAAARRSVPPRAGLGAAPDPRPRCRAGLVARRTSSRRRRRRRLLIVPLPPRCRFRGVVFYRNLTIVSDASRLT